jgi:uncharacterized protein (DUF1786 family)
MVSASVEDRVGRGGEVDVESPDLDVVLARVVGERDGYLVVHLAREERWRAGGRGCYSVEVCGRQRLYAVAAEGSAVKRW